MVPGERERIVVHVLIDEVEAEGAPQGLRLGADEGRGCLGGRQQRPCLDVESRVAEVRIGPGIGELARQRQAFAAEAEVMAQLQRLLLLEIEIGRESCRERVCQYV